MAVNHSFEAVIQAAGRGGAFVFVPFDVEKVFGKKRVPIWATVDGEPYRGTLVRMGSPQHMFPVLKSIRKKIGKEPGDTVRVTLEEDTQPRVVEVPGDLAEALRASPQAGSKFRALSYTHQKEYVRWITEAKREETRRRRISKTLEDLRS